MTNRGRGRGVNVEPVHTRARGSAMITRGGRGRTDTVVGSDQVVDRNLSGNVAEIRGTSSNSNHVAVIDNSCGLCSRSVGTDAIGCDSCPLWFHATTQCTGLRQDAIAVIQSTGGDGIVFKCSRCRCTNHTASTSPSGGVTNSGNPAIDPGAMLQIFEMVKSLAETVTALTQQVAILVAQPNTNSRPATAGGSPIQSREELYAELWEFEERRKRKDSLIVRGSGSQNVAVFTEFFADVSEALTGQRTIPDQTYCISQERSLYRVKISDFKVRSNIMDKSRNLRNIEEYKNIYINRDLTFKQREELRTRRDSRRRDPGADGINHDAHPYPNQNVSSQGQGVDGTSSVPLQNF